MPDGPAQLTSAWFDAWRTKDAGAIERMIAPEYVYVAPNGAVLNRDTILGIIRDPSYRIASGTHTEVSVVHLGTEAALVLHHWRGQALRHALQIARHHQRLRLQELAHQLLELTNDFMLIG